MLTLFQKVPVLAHETDLSKPLAESLDITLYLAKHYRTLIPETHKVEIESLLGELHSVNYFTLSYGLKAQVPMAMVNLILEQLRNPDISSRYREALLYKLAV